MYKYGILFRCKRRIVRRRYTRQQKFSPAIVALFIRSNSIYDIHTTFRVFTSIVDCT